MASEISYSRHKSLILRPPSTFRGWLHNVINGGAGNELITGGSGNDQIFGDGNAQQAGDDVIDRGAGADLLVGFVSANTMIANYGEADTVNGEPSINSCTTRSGGYRI